jgi:hypothetical protein
MEVLAAFVRSHAPLTACSSKPEVPATLAADVQATLTIIGRDAAHAELSDSLDLSQTCLVDAKLSVVDLSCAYLTRRYRSPFTFRDAKVRSHPLAKCPNALTEAP